MTTDAVVTSPHAIPTARLPRPASRFAFDLTPDLSFRTRPRGGRAGLPGDAAGNAAGVWEFSARQCIRYAVLWQIAAFVLLSVQLLLICAFGPMTAVLGLAGLILLFVRMPLAGATVFLQVLLYQNWFLSVFCRLGIDRGSFQLVQALGFASVCGLACVAVVRIRGSRRGGRGTAVAVSRWICIALVVTLAYTIYGATKSSPASSLAYLRNTSAMLLALLVGLDLGRLWSYRTFATIFLVSILFGVAIDVAEIAMPSAYYEAIDAVDFVSLKSGDPAFSAPSVDDLVRSRIVTWFNLTGGDGRHVSIRSGGPNMHPVSYAYVVAVTGIVGATLGRAEVVAVAIGMLFMAGIKGPLLMLVATIAIFSLWWITRRRRFVLAASLLMLVVYVGSGIRIGMSNGDFHVIGLLGGLHGFMTTPQGHGIGVGGNLSALAGQGLDWSAWQKLGVDFALESAVGVLLYQMGVAAAAIYLPIIWLVVAGLRRQAVRFGRHLASRATPTDALFIGIGAMLANGFFQEEAYSPYALGLLTLLGGIAVSNADVARPLRPTSCGNPET